MHELGLVNYAVKDVSKIAEEHNVRKIKSVTLEFGEVSGIVTDLFTDAWDYFKIQHPILKNSTLELETKSSHCKDVSCC